MSLTDEQKQVLEMAARTMRSRVHFQEYEEDKIQTARQLCDLGLFQQMTFAELVEARIDRGRMYRITGQGMLIYADIQNAASKTDRYKNALEDVLVILNDWSAKGHESVVNEAIKRIRLAFL